MSSQPEPITLSTRRALLKAFLGAAFLPAALVKFGPIEKIHEEELEDEGACWLMALEEPVIFYVVGTNIVDPSGLDTLLDYKEPTNAEAFGLDEGILASSALLAETAQENWIFEFGLASILAARQDTLPPDSPILELLECEGEDPGDWMYEWIKQLSPSQRKDLTVPVRKWMDDLAEFEWSRDWVGSARPGTDMAFHFFWSVPAEIRHAIGIRLIDGDCPGNDYQGAELTIPVDEANHRAERDRIPIRFVEQFV